MEAENLNPPKRRQNVYTEERRQPWHTLRGLSEQQAKQNLKKILQGSPLKTRDINLILDYADGASYKELAAKYNKSPQQINQ